jgi:hypothetical protein
MKRVCLREFYLNTFYCEQRYAAALKYIDLRPSAVSGFKKVKSCLKMAK